ncbi:MAG: transposase [Candidatus Paceibacterota bacterium]
MKRIYFENGKIYHVYNRGVDKRIIFNNQNDYLRFLSSLDDFNSLKPIDKENEIINKVASGKREPEDEKVKNSEENILVDVLAFCLMPNHFHLLLKQKREGGVSKFMQRITTGHTMNFNFNEKRSGTLFQGRFKAICVDRQEYLDYLIFYIHFNPLTLIDGGWTNNKNIAFNFLNNYNWSSHLDYLNINEIKDLYSLLDERFLLENFKSSNEYIKKTFEWLEIIKEKNKHKSFIIKAIDYEE